MIESKVFYSCTACCSIFLFQSGWQLALPTGVSPLFNQDSSTHCLRRVYARTVAIEEYHYALHFIVDLPYQSSQKRLALVCYWDCLASVISDGLSYPDCCITSRHYPPGVFVKVLFLTKYFISLHVDKA